MDIHNPPTQTQPSARFERPEELLSGQIRLLRMIALGFPLAQVLDDIIHFMETQSRKALCSVLLLDSSKTTLRFAAAPSLPKAYNDYVDGLKVGPNHGSCGTAIFRRESVRVFSIETDPLWEVARPFALKHGLKACSSVPILDSQGEPLGTFAFYYREEMLPDWHDISLIEVSRDLASLAIQHARHEEQQEELYLREHHARTEAERLNSAKDEFMSVAAHELKTPIAALKMQIDVSLIRCSRMSELSQSFEIRDDLNRAKNLCERLIKLNENLLDVTRIRTSKLNLRPEKLDLVDIVRSLIRTYMQYTDTILLSVPDSPVIGYFDRSRMEQVVRNLLDNAIKFGEGRSIELKLHTFNDSVEIEVRDHGIGISLEEQGKIFHRFEQLNSKVDVRGLGLGLYIVSEIVKAHKGTIRVESELGKGSTFVVHLPSSMEMESESHDGH